MSLCSWWKKRREEKLKQKLAGIAAKYAEPIVPEESYVSRIHREVPHAGPRSQAAISRTLAGKHGDDEALASQAVIQSSSGGLLAGILLAEAAEEIISSGSDSSEASKPAWSGSGGEFDGGGASGSWDSGSSSSDSSSSSSDSSSDYSSSSDSGSSDSGSSSDSGGGSFD